MTFPYCSHLGQNPILQCIKTTRTRLVDKMLEIFGRHSAPVSVGLPVAFTGNIGGLPLSLQTNFGVVPSNSLPSSFEFLCTQRS
jgi:hypothetical protein